MSILTTYSSVTVRRWPSVAVAVCAVILFVPGAGLAQESRLAVIAAQQAAKAAQLVPESDSKYALIVVTGDTPAAIRCRSPSVRRNPRCRPRTP